MSVVFSSRKVNKIVALMCGSRVSSQMVSDAAKKLDEALSAWSLGRLFF